MRVDCLIVGAGIAGCVLADHLLEAGLSIKVIDEPSLSNSSKVAGGLYNPITGRKMVKTWMCDPLFDYLIPYYKQLEKRLDSNFLKETPIYRPFFSIEEQNEWMAKSADESFEPYISEIKSKPFQEELVLNPNGGLLLNKSGYLDTSDFLSAFKRYLIEKEMLIEEQFDFSGIERDSIGFDYEGHQFKMIIFSDGRLSTKNPYFSWLPFSLVKGELLFIKASVTPRVIFNRGVFVIPVGNGIFKCGSTYDHSQLDEIPTKLARNELLERVKKLINFDFVVVDHKAGVRPATKDRKPFIGEHPTEKGIWAFNGMGTKGVSLAPYFARELTNHLNDSQPLNPEVNIDRFFSLI